MDEIKSHERSVREFMAKDPFSRSNLTHMEISLFCTALTHDSFSDEAHKFQIPKDIESYERLEFLGDAVVELSACEYIYLNSELCEGRMTSFKQEIVANKKISERLIQKGIDIDSVMLVGHGHRDKRSKMNIIEDSMRADAFEAIVGAFYLLYGMDEAKRIVHDVLLT